MGILYSTFFVRGIVTDTQFSSDSDMVGGSARSPAAFRSARHSISFLVCQLPLASSLLFEVRIRCHGSLLHIVLYRSLHAGLELALEYLLCSRLCYKFGLHCRCCEVQSSSPHSELFNYVWQSGTQAEYLVFTTTYLERVLHWTLRWVWMIRS